MTDNVQNLLALENKIVLLGFLMSRERDYDKYFQLLIQFIRIRDEIKHMEVKLYDTESMAMPIRISVAHT